MNMERLKRARKVPEPGNIFVYRMKDREYGFGRVIRNDAVMGGFPNSLLVYIYNAFAQRKEDIPLLDKNNLLLPPLGIGRTLWTAGYFETVRKETLKAEDALDSHSFRDDILERKCDEYGKTIHKRTHDMGPWVIGNYITTDVKLSLALGIEPDPDTLPDKKKWPRLVP